MNPDCQEDLESNMQDETRLCIQWIHYFVRPSQHWAPKTCEEYRKRIERWAGEPVRTEAFVKAASQLGYEIQGDRIKAAVMG